MPQASRLWPAVSVQASASRSSSGLPAPVKQGMPDTRALRAGIDMAWAIDLAGGVRAARDAAQADTTAAAGVQGARLRVVSEIARQYFVLRSAHERLRIVQALAKAQRDTASHAAFPRRESSRSKLSLESRLKHHRALSVIPHNNHIEPTVGKPLRGSLDDIARQGQPTPIHPQHGAHHHG